MALLFYARMKEIVIPVRRRFTADDSIYGVRVIGTERDDGIWEARVEFQSRSGIRLGAPTGEHLNVDRLSSWAARLGEDTLRDALNRASIGLIQAVERRS